MNISAPRRIGGRHDEMHPFARAADVLRNHRNIVGGGQRRYVAQLRKPAAAVAYPAARCSPTMLPQQLPEPVPILLMFAGCDANLLQLGVQAGVNPRSHRAADIPPCGTPGKRPSMSTMSRLFGP